MSLRTKVILATVSTVLLGGALAAPAGAAAPEGSLRVTAAHRTTMSPQAVICRFTGDGVRIHPQPSTGSTTVGLAYKGQSFMMQDGAGGPPNWMRGTDLETGVSGWVTMTYLTHCFE